MNRWLLLLLLFIAPPLSAQNTITKDTTFTVVEKMPSYPGGEQALFKFLRNTIKYPAKARRKGISGRVFINFVIDREGNVTNARVLKGVHKSLDKEAIRVVEQMPKWKPGTQRGKTVKVSYNIPIRFTLYKPPKSPHKFKRANKLWKKGNSYLVYEKYDNVVSKDKDSLALKYFNKAIKIYPKHKSSYDKRGLVYYHLGKYQLAMDDFNTVLMIDSNYYSAYTHRGLLYTALRQYEKAERDFVKAVDYNNTDYVAYFNLGFFYQTKGAYEESIKAYDEAIELNPNYILNYNNRGFTKVLNGSYEDAIEDLTIAIQMDSLYKSAWNNRGLAHYYLKQYEEAIYDFKSSFKAPSFFYTKDIEHYMFNNMANSYYALGQVEEACKYWQMAVSKGYVYQTEWKEMYNIDDPLELIQTHCK